MYGQGSETREKKSGTRNHYSYYCLVRSTSFFTPAIVKTVRIAALRLLHLKQESTALWVRVGHLDVHTGFGGKQEEKQYTPPLLLLQSNIA